MKAIPAGSRHRSAIGGVVAALAIVAGCSGACAEDESSANRAAADRVMDSAPRAPQEGRDPDARLLFVSGRDGQGLIDTQGRIVVEPEFDWASSSSEGRAAVARRGLFGYVDGTGRIVIEPAWQDGGSFHDGLAMVATDIKITVKKFLGPIHEGGKRGYIDRDGKVVIAPKFDEARSFNEGVAWVADGKRWGLIDRTGKYLIEPRYQQEPPMDFSGGLCPVWQDGAWNTDDSAEHVGYIDTTGATVIPATFRAGGSFSNGIATIVKGGKLGVIDRSGKLIVEPRFEWGSVSTNTRLPAFSEGLAPVKVGDDYGFIDTTGRIAIEARYGRSRESAMFGAIDPGASMEFREGLAGVVVDGKTGFIDKNGTLIVAPQFERVNAFDNGIARVEVVFGLWGYIRRDGSFIWNPIQPREH